LYQISLPWQPGSDVVEFVRHHSIARPRKPRIARKDLPGIEDTNTHLVTSEPTSLRIPLSIDVYLEWSSSLCFIVCLFYTSHYDKLTFTLFVCSA